ncbi:MAG: type II secretion system protein GspD [Chlamydiae bacterium]|nr:type II secretion system protein GspD [Chlamydiota bacterium]
MQRFLVLIFLVFITSICSEEKGDIIFEKQIKKVNEELSFLKNKLKQKYFLAIDLFNQKSQEPLLKLYEEIKELKAQIFSLEETFRKESASDQLKNDEGYAFWDQGETTLAEIVMEYGSCDYLYVIPPEIGSMKINLFSTLPIPRKSWNEMIELILAQNGIGVKKLSATLRQLYVLKHDLSCIEAIVTKKEDLEFLSESAAIFYVFSPPIEQLKAVQGFFERFSDIKSSSVQIVGNKVVIVASKETIKRLLELYDTIWENQEGKVVKVFPLTKINSADVEKILKAFFLDSVNRGKGTFNPSALEDVIILPQPNSVILIGEAPLIERADKMLQNLQNQLENPEEMTIFWYTCKHSNPEDLAEVLEQVYSSLSSARFEDEKIKPDSKSLFEKYPSTRSMNNNAASNHKMIDSGKNNSQSSSKSSNNFIVDPKTGSILMVVKKDELPKIQDLLKKIDVPKKMVQIDILLVERKLHDREQTGINLLKIGSTKNIKSEGSGISFNANSNAERKGLLDFIISHSKGNLPALDITLSFLMAQENLHINANPSILTMNQTPACISITDEVSINNGAVALDSSSSGLKYEKSFSRAEFGIFISMTPTIHLSQDKSEEKGFITLQTDVTFQTFQETSDDRPPVTKRHIENEVRVADGETIILGGLRRKTKENTSEKIPFLGEIPGVGKLFGTTKMTDSSTEMFIFITPHIIKDPIEDLRQLKEQELQKRNGDLPELLEKLTQAKELEKSKAFENSLKLIFDDHEKL